MATLEIRPSFSSLSHKAPTRLAIILYTCEGWPASQRGDVCVCVAAGGVSVAA